MESVTNIEAICSAVVDEAFHVHAEIGKPLGLLINFGAATFREGCFRVVNGPVDRANSPLRVNHA